MRPLSIGKAWDEAKAALQAHRRLIIPVALGLVLLPAVIAAMVEPQAPAGQQPPAGLWMLVAAAMIVVMMIGQIALVLLVNGWRGSVGEAIGKAARRTPVAIVALLSYLIPVVLVFSVAMTVAGVRADASGQVDSASLGALGGLVLLACLVALIYLSVRLIPLVAVVASEAVGPIAALKRSFGLTSGHFWRLLAFLLILFLGFLVAAVTAGAVIGSMIKLALGDPEPWSLSLLLIALAGGLVQAAFVTVYSAMLARIYAQLAAPTATVPEVSREAD